MNILKRTQGIDLSARSGAIRGDVTIQLRDALTGKITDEQTSHNMLTNGLNNALNECPFGLNKVDTMYGSTGGTMLRPIPLFTQLLGGVILFPQTLGNDTDLLYPSFGNSPTGFASMSDYSQTDSRQGTYDTVSSGVITNGFRHVFSWGSAYGNGTIASLGLSTRNAHMWCKSTLDMFKPFTLSAEATGFKTSKASSNTKLIAVTEKGTLFAFYNSTYGYSRIQFFKQLKPYTLSLFETRFSEIDHDNVFSDEHRNGYTWENTSDIPNFGTSPLRYTAQIVGDYVYIIYHTGGNFTVKKLAIADGTLVSTDTYTFTGSFGGGKAVLYGNYIYCTSSTAGTIYKCDITRATEAGYEPDEITATGLSAESHLFFCNTQFIYATDGIFDAESDIFQSANNPICYALDQWFVNPVAEYGNWLIFNAGSGISVTMKQWGLMTHYDLQSEVTKNATKQMIVQYSITQV